MSDRSDANVFGSGLLHLCQRQLNAARRMGRALAKPIVRRSTLMGFAPLYPSYELSNILRVVEDDRDLLLKAWHDHFGN